MRTAEGRSILLLFNIEIIIVHSPRLSQLHCLWDANVLLCTFIRLIDPFIIWNSWNRIIFTTTYQPYCSPLIFSLTTDTVFGSAFSFWTYNSVRKTLLANYISTIALAFSKKKKRLVNIRHPWNKDKGQRHWIQRRYGLLWNHKLILVSNTNTFSSSIHFHYSSLHTYTHSNQFQFNLVLHCVLSLSFPQLRTRNDCLPWSWADYSLNKQNKQTNKLTN